jgi:chromosome segregation ATPase
LEPHAEARRIGLKQQRAKEEVAMEAQLKRGLFGYSRKSVRAVVDDREESMVKTSRRAREGEAKIEGIATELAESRIEIADLQARNRDLESKLEDAAERFRAVERSASTSTTEGLTDVLQAAERELHRLTDRAREDAEMQLGETERVHDALRKDIDRLAAWRARMAPLAESIPGSIEEFRKETSAIADRLHEALAPATDALDVLATRLSELAESPESPTPDQGAEVEVISVGEANNGAASEMTGAELGVFEELAVFEWPSDRPAPSSGE